MEIVGIYFLSLVRCSQAGGGGLDQRFEGAAVRVLGGVAAQQLFLQGLEVRVNGMMGAGRGHGCIAAAA